MTDTTPDRTPPTSVESVETPAVISGRFDGPVGVAPPPGSFERAQEVASPFMLGAPVPDLVEVAHRFLPEVNAWRFWLVCRGGLAVIVAEDGSFLSAGSATSPDHHVDEFAKGRRTDPTT